MAHPLTREVADQDVETESPFQILAADLMDFLRDSGSVEAIDLGVWLYRGNAEDQLAGYLAERVKDPNFPGLPNLNHHEY